MSRTPGRTEYMDERVETSVAKLKIRVRRIVSYTHEGVPVWGSEAIAAFRYVRDAERFITSTTNPKSYVIEQDEQRVVGHDGHGYAILDALDKHEIWGPSR